MASSIRRRVMLVAPPFGDVPGRGGRYYTTIPLGTAYLASALLEAGLEVDVVDCNVESHSPGDLADRVVSKSPDIVGLSVTTPSSRYCRAFVSALRGRGVSSAITVALGGAHVTADPEAARLIGGDVYFKGEAERCFRDYCLVGGGGGVVKCPPIEDIDSLPRPARHLFDGGRYAFVPVAASRGCPFSCIYCCMAGTGYRRRSLGGLRLELEEIVRGKPKSLDFVDDTFTLDKDFALGVAALMSGYGVPWACTTRADMVDEELIGRFSECGCMHMSFGVESGDEKVRHYAGKGVADGTIKAAFKSCRDAGIKTRAYMMLGLPGDTGTTMEASREFMEEIEPDDVQYSPPVPYPGTRLMETAVREGRISPRVWADYTLGNAEIPVYSPEGFSGEEIIALCNDAQKSFHGKGARIMRRLASSTTWTEAGETVMAALALTAEPLFNKRR